MRNGRVSLTSIEGDQLGIGLPFTSSEVGLSSSFTASTLTLVFSFRISNVLPNVSHPNYATKCAQIPRRPLQPNRLTEAHSEFTIVCFTLFSLSLSIAFSGSLHSSISPHKHWVQTENKIELHFYLPIKIPDPILLWGGDWRLSNGEGAD